MSEQARLPLIYILHGAWHSPECFAPVVERLQSLGYDTMCSQQPSTGFVSGKVTLYDDAAFVRAELESLIQSEDEGGQARDVVVVMHSYGGMVGTEACAGLAKAERRVQNERERCGGIISLLYVASFLLPVGNSLCTPLGGELAPFIEEDTSTGLCRPHLLPPSRHPNPSAPNTLFYNDLPNNLAAHYTSLLRPHSAVAQRTPLTHAAYLSIPTSYLFCEGDRALPLNLQREMVAATNRSLQEQHERKETGESGTESSNVIQEYSCSAGHSPFLSQTERFVDFVLQSIPISG